VEPHVPIKEKNQEKSPKMSGKSAWGKPASVQVVSLNQLMQDELEAKKVKDQEKQDLDLAMQLQAWDSVDEYGGNEAIEVPAMGEVPAQSSTGSSHQMDEDSDLALALKLQAELNGEQQVPEEKKDQPSIKGKSKFDDDYLLALKLQTQYDQDFNRYLSSYEKQKNAMSKVQVSYDKYRIEEYPEDENEGFEVEDMDDLPDEVPKSTSQRAPMGKKTKRMKSKKTNSQTTQNQKKVVITKHDIDKNSLNNTRKMERLPEIEIGNAPELKNLRLPYKVYNALKHHALQAAAKKENRSKMRLFDKEDTATEDRVLDRRTKLILFQMLNNGKLDQIDGLVSTGKEANVYYGLSSFNDEDNWEDVDKDENAVAESDHMRPSVKRILDNYPQGSKAIEKSPEAEGDAQEQNEQEAAGEEGDEGEEEEEEAMDDSLVQFEVVIKVFKTTLNEFKNREEYIREDSRYAGRITKHNPRKLIKLWAEKETTNLKRMKSAGIPCPEVFFFQDHVIILSLIGSEKKAAPKLRDVGKLLSMSRREDLYDQTIQNMRLMYQVARLVHADLSEYNLLYHDHQVWFIDVSQAVETIHPNARLFLFRDCCNITRFFREIGINVMSEIELYAFVTLQTLSGENEVEMAEEIRRHIEERLGENVQVSLRDLDIQDKLNRLMPTFFLEEEAKWDQQEENEEEYDDDDELGTCQPDERDF